jgi:hypothetical protein
LGIVSRYTDFSGKVLSCLEDSKLLVPYLQHDDPKNIPFDVLLSYFVARLKNLQETIELLGKDAILADFAGHYPTLDADLRRDNCGSYHQFAIKRAEDAFRRVMRAAIYGTEPATVGRCPKLNERALSKSIADIRIDPQKIEENWDAFYQAAAESTDTDLTGVSAELQDECLRTERAAVTAERAAAAGIASATEKTQSIRDNDPGQLTSEARAILFVQERIKTTGKVPTKTAIAEALDVNRRTLNNWSAFKAAYKQLQSRTRRQPARGSKGKDGTLESWRENGK